MTAAAFDAGMRVAAAETGKPVRRVDSPVIWCPRIHRFDTVTVARSGRNRYVSPDLGITSPTPPQVIVKAVCDTYRMQAFPVRLVVDDRGTFEMLMSAARSAANDPEHPAGVGRFRWWADQATLPTGWVVMAVDAARTHFVTGDPKLETNVAGWAKAFGQPCKETAAVAVIMREIAALGSNRAFVTDTATEGMKDLQFTLDAGSMKARSSDDLKLFCLAEAMWGAFNSNLMQDPRWMNRAEIEGRILRGVTNDSSIEGCLAVHTTGQVRFKEGDRLHATGQIHQSTTKKGDARTVRPGFVIRRIEGSDNGLIVHLAQPRVQDQRIDLDDTGWLELFKPVESVAGVCSMVRKQNHRLTRFTWLTALSQQAPVGRSEVPLYVIAAAGAAAAEAA